MRVSREDLCSILFLFKALLLYILDFKGIIKTPIGLFRVNDKNELRSFAYGFFKTHFLYLHSLRHISSANRFYQVVVDVGANTGDFALAITNHAGKIIAVEPGESSFEALKANLQINNLKNVLPLEIAAHEREEEVFLEGNSSDMYVTRKKKGQSAKGMPLRKIIHMLRLESVDLLKIDVQGHERSVLLGALKLFQDKVVKLLIIEVHLRRHVSITEIISFLESCNYHLIYKDNYLSAQPHLYFKPLLTVSTVKTSKSHLEHCDTS